MGLGPCAPATDWPGRCQSLELDSQTGFSRAHRTHPSAVHPWTGPQGLFLRGRRGPGGCSSASASGRRPAAASSGPQWQENPGGHRAVLAWRAPPSPPPSCQHSNWARAVGPLGSGKPRASVPSLRANPHRPEGEKSLPVLSHWQFRTWGLALRGKRE